MSRKRLWLALGIVAVPVALFIAWSRSGRGSAASTDFSLERAVSYGTDAGNGNLLGVEPLMVGGDYASADNFHARLDGYLAAADAKGWLGPKTVVVFPEYTGTWLVAMDEKRSVYTAPSTGAALKTVVLSNPVAFVRALRGARERDKAAGAVFRMKAPAMAAAYDKTFSGLARAYGVTIVAGSIILPFPTVAGGRLHIGDGPLFNVSVVYGPDGAARGLVKKVYPTGEEQPFCAAASPDDLSIFETPAGRLGVLVCADSWSPALYARLAQGRPDLLAVPSFGAEPGVWNAPWKGYDGQATPEGASAADVGAITEKQAWLKYALPARLRESGARAGINVFSRNRFWGYHGDAQTLTVAGDALHVRDLGPEQGGALINLWL